MKKIMFGITLCMLSLLASCSNDIDLKSGEFGVYEGVITETTCKKSDYSTVTLDDAYSFHISDSDCSSLALGSQVKITYKYRSLEAYEFLYSETTETTKKNEK